MTVNPPRIAASLLVAALSQTALAGPIASAVLNQQDQIVPGFDIIVGFGNSPTTVLANGDFALYVRTRNVVTSVETDHFWGSIAEAEPAILRSESPSLAGWTQDRLDSSVGLDEAGRLTYSARLVNDSPPPVTFDSVWVNDTLIAAEDTQFTAGPLTAYWNFHSSPQLTPAGDLYWRSGYAASPNAGDEGQGIFLVNDPGLSTLLRTDDPVGGTSEVVDGGSFPISGNWYLSDNAAHYMVEVRVSPSGDEIIVIDGSIATTASGMPFRQGNPIPQADGGHPGETMDDFYSYAINDAGRWIMTAPTSASEDDAIWLDGRLAYRENDVIDGHVLDGIPEAEDINNTGDWAFIWNDALILNGNVLLRPGDLVDQDPKDGVPETALDSLAVIKLTVADRRQGVVDLWFQGDTVADRSIFRMSTADAGRFGACVSGPIEAAGFVAPSEACLLAYDMPPADGDVDLADFMAFQALVGQQ